MPRPNGGPAPRVTSSKGSVQMKFLLGLVLLGAIGFGIYMYTARDSTPKKQTGVHIGATVEEVEKVLGPPVQVLPQFGRQTRIYKAKSGEKYMLVFENNK